MYHPIIMYTVDLNRSLVRHLPKSCDVPEFLSPTTDDFLIIICSRSNPLGAVVRELSVNEQKKIDVFS